MNDEEASRLEGHRVRAHIVEGLIRAFESGGELLDVVHSSADRAEARQALMAPPWQFTDIVASYILDAPYGRTTRLGRADLAEELVQLRQIIGDSQ